MTKSKEEFLKQFDTVLDANDPNFVADFAKAIGVEPGETIEIMTPQFTRADGRVVSYIPKTPEEYAALPQMKPDALKKIGCQIWDDEDGKRHWLYPHEWYNHIPDGTEIIDISGNVERFKRGETDDDMRFGALAFGFIQPI